MSATLSHEHAQAVALYRDGKTRNEIAAALGRSVSFVQSALRRAGLCVYRGSVPQSEVIAKIRAGRTTTDIASDYGVSDSYIRQIAGFAGVRSQPKRGTLTARIREKLYEHETVTDETCEMIAEQVGAKVQYVRDLASIAGRLSRRQKRNVQ